MKYQLIIEPTQGYAPDQTKTITVGELKGALALLEDDAEICTYSPDNIHGAAFGGLTTEIEETEDIDDIDEYLRNKPSN